jgi:phosphoglucomutase
MAAAAPNRKSAASSLARRSADPIEASPVSNGHNTPSDSGLKTDNCAGGGATKEAAPTTCEEAELQGKAVSRLTRLEDINFYAGSFERGRGAKGTT